MKAGRQADRQTGRQGLPTEVLQVSYRGPMADSGDRLGEIVMEQRSQHSMH